MQNKYVGDVGDFGKYGLLRALTGHNPKENQKFSLGVVWHLVPDETHTNDGKHIRYLEDTDGNRKSFQNCDEKLWGALQIIVKERRRSVASIKQAGILPDTPDTVFFSEEVPLDKEGRQGWLGRAKDTVAKCDLIFLDPDTGLECKSVRPGTKKSPKYAFFDELAIFCERGRRNLVIYHHLGRHKSAEKQITHYRDAIRKTLKAESFVMQYHRGTARAFFVIPARNHKGLFCSRMHQFVQGSWGKHFTLHC